MPNFEEKRGVSYTEEEKKIYETMGGTPHLDGQYTVFGQVVEGMDVVERIANAKTNGMNLPIEPIYIIKMKLIK